MKSGTSMAAPHISGGLAVILNTLTHKRPLDVGNSQVMTGLWQQMAVPWTAAGPTICDLSLG